jgi:ABC-type transport system involved in multi-copper enzyme maturation permease subunit
MMTLIKNTFKEKIRSKTLYITGGIGIVVMFLVTTGDGLTINGLAIIDFHQRVPVAMAIMNFLGSLLAIMISLQTIPNEFERKTTHLVLVRGIKPWQYMFSLTVGNILSSLVCVFSMYIPLLLFCSAFGKGYLIFTSLGAIIILSLNTILISAIVSLLSIRVPVFINGVLCIVIYFLGVFHNMLSVAAKAMVGLKGTFMKLIMYVVPNFAAVQNEASDFMLHQPVESYTIVIQLLYLYIILSLTFLIFRKEV